MVACRGGQLWIEPSPVHKDVSQRSGSCYIVGHY